MDRLELTSRYAPVGASDAKSLWEDVYDSCLKHCMHGASCSLGASCNQGRRITTVRLLCCTCVRYITVLVQASDESQ